MKNVHFAGDESLRTVHVFNASGKPINGSKQQAADEPCLSPHMPIDEYLLVFFNKCTIPMILAIIEPYFWDL